MSSTLTQVIAILSAVGVILTAISHLQLRRQVKQSPPPAPPAAPKP